MKIQKLLTYETSVNYQTSKTKSLKVGFPKEISEILEISAGEKIRWCVNLVDGKIIITVENISDE